MKKVWCFSVLLILCFGICACCAEETKAEIKTETKAETKTEIITDNTLMETIRITFRNEGQEADVWIIPNTEENRKTTLWGTASVAKSTPGAEYTVNVTKSESDEYLLYMIDTEEMYYESGAITLLNDYKVTVSQMEENTQLVISDVTGKTVFKKFVFKAAL